MAIPELRHIYRFERKYYKAFAKYPLFGAYFMDCINVTCSGVFTLLQHDHHRGRGVGGPRGVRWSSEEVSERGVVYIDAVMGGSVINKGGGTPEIQRTLDWSKAKRQGRGTRSDLQQQSRSAAADHRETGRYDGGNTLGEPPPPLGGGW